MYDRSRSLAVLFVNVISVNQNVLAICTVHNFNAAFSCEIQRAQRCVYAHVFKCSGSATYGGCMPVVQNHVTKILCLKIYTECKCTIILHGKGCFQLQTRTTLVPRQKSAVTYPLDQSIQNYWDKFSMNTYLAVFHTLLDPKFNKIY